MSDSRTVRFVIEADSAGAVTRVLTFNAALRELGPTSERSGKKIESSFGRIEAMLGKMKSAVIGFIGAFAFGAAIRGMSEIIDAGIRFEATFANVKKTADGTALQFEHLAEGIRRLSEEIPIGVENLNSIAAIGGQQGLKATELLRFTETIAKLKLAVEGISAEDAAEQLAMLSTVMGEPISRLKTMSNALVKLGNDFVGNEGQILKFSMNMAGAAAQTTITTEQLFALSTALIGTGLRSEKAGTAMSRVMFDMRNAVDEGGKKLEAFSRVTTRTAEGFAQLFKQDTMKAIQEWMVGVHKSADAGGNLAKILEEVGFKEARVRDVTTRLQEASENLGKTLNSVTAGAKGLGNALDNEVAKKLATARAELDKVWARMNNIAIDISDSLTPALVDLAKMLVPVAENWRAIAVAAEAFVVAMLSMRFTAWITSLGALSLAVRAVGTALTASVLSSPLITAAALAASLAAIYKIAEAWREAKQAQNDLVQAQTDQSNAQFKKQATAVNKDLLTWRQILDSSDPDKLVNDALRGSAELDRMLSEAAAKRVADAKAAATVQASLDEEFEKRVKNMMDNATKLSDSADELAASLARFSKTSMPQSTILEVYGEQALQTRDLLHQMGKAVDAGISALAAAFENEAHQKAVDEFVERTNKMKTAVADHYAKMVQDAAEFEFKLQAAIASGMHISDLVKEFGSDSLKFEESLEAIGKPVGPLTDKLSDFTEMVRNSKRALDNMLNTDYSEIFAKINIPMPELPIIDIGDVNGGRPAPVRPPGLMTEQQRKEFEEMSKGIARAMDRMFETLVKKGKLAWKDIGNFAVELFENMASKLFKPLQDALLNPLANALGSIASKLTDSLFNIDADGKISGIFGGLGKKFGAILGGLASAGIGAAISVGISALSGLFKKSGSEVNNNLVNDIQNPFTEVVGKLHDSFMETNAAGKLTLESAIAMREELTKMLASFKEDAAAYAATGAKQATAVRGMFDTISRYWGEDLAVIFNKMNAVITDLGGSADMTSEQLAQLNTALAAVAEFENSVAELMAAFRVDTEEVRALETALVALATDGISAARITAGLGNDITRLADALRAADMAIPPLISHYDNMLRAQRAFETAQAAYVQQLHGAENRLSSVNNELVEVENSIKNALISKLNLLDNQINESGRNIDNWRGDVAALDNGISDLRAKLEDAEYWQRKYSDSIRDAENDLKQLSEQRKSIEERIADLTIQIEEDRLNAIIKTSKNASVIKAAELQLARLARKDEEERITQLAELKAQLPEIIRLEQEAAAALQNKQAEAARLITVEQEQMRQSILVKEAERAAIQANIEAEIGHVAALSAAREATLQQMNLFNAVRQSEIEKIDATIDSLIRRKAALEGERQALEGLIDMLRNNPIEPPDIQNGLPAAVQHIADAPRPGYGGYGPSPTMTLVASDPVTGLPIQNSTSETNILHVDGVEVHVHVSGISADGTTIGQEAARAFVSTIERDADLRQRISRLGR